MYALATVLVVVHSLTVPGCELQDLEVLSQFIGARLPRLPQYAAAMAAAHQDTWQRWLETRAPLLT